MIRNILITSAGRRVSLVKNFQKTLKMFNPEGRVYTTDLNPSMSAACHVSDGYVKVPRVTDPRYLDQLEAYCKAHEISIIVPTIDTELHLLAAARDRFTRAGISLAVSSESFCKTFYLKESTEIFFTEHGFETPRRIPDLETCRYPVFAKLNNSSCSIGARKVTNATEALQLAENGEYIFQEFIEGREFTVDVFIDRRGETVAVVPRERIEVRAGEVSKARTVRDRRIIDEVKRLCGVLEGAYGCITVQLFQAGERIVFIEINPRFGGGYPLSYLAGADFAKYLIEDYLGKELQYTEEWRADTVMLRYDAEVIVDGHRL